MAGGLDEQRFQDWVRQTDDRLRRVEAAVSKFSVGDWVVEANSNGDLIARNTSSGAVEILALA